MTTVWFIALRSCIILYPAFDSTPGGVDVLHGDYQGTQEATPWKFIQGVVKPSSPPTL